MHWCEATAFALVIALLESVVFPTLVYVQWDAGNKQNEAYAPATLLRFELARRIAK
jgi:hypothetical protein